MCGAAAQEHTETSVRVTILDRAGGTEHCLLLSPLYEEVEGVGKKKKADKLVVFLKKATTFKWLDLLKKESK